MDTEISYPYDAFVEDVEELDRQSDEHWYTFTDDYRRRLWNFMVQRYPDDKDTLSVRYRALLSAGTSAYATVAACGERWTDGNGRLSEHLLRAIYDSMYGATGTKANADPEQLDALAKRYRDQGIEAVLPRDGAGGPS